MADSIGHIEKTRTLNKHPVAVGVPGYVLPTDINVRLFLKYPKTVKLLKVEPEGALAIEKIAAPSSGYQSYSVKGKAWGRSRLTVTYADRLVQTVYYFATKPETQVVDDMGHFLAT